MKILKVTGHNFRSFPDFEWTPPQQGLVLLDGQNLDTGGSNMSGKSSLLDSVFWCLYGWLPRWDGPKGGSADAVIHRGEKSCWVQIELQVGRDIIMIKRRRPSSLEIKVNGESIAADAQKEIDRRVMTPARFLASVLASQDRNVSFFTMGDAERTELLSVVANLESLDKALARAKAERDAVDKELISLKAKLESQAARVLEFPVLIEESRREIQEFTQRVDHATMRLQTIELAAAQEVLDAQQLTSREQQKAQAVYDERIKEIENLNQDIIIKTNAAIDQLAKTYQSIRAELNEVPKPEPELSAAIQKAFKELEDAKSFNRKVDQIIKDNEKTMDKISRLLEEAEAHTQGSCRACGQQLPQWDRERAANEKIDQAKTLEASIKEIPERLLEDDGELRRAEASLAARKAELEVRPAKIKAELQAVESQLNEAKTKVKSIESQMARDRAEANQQLMQVKVKADQVLTQAKQQADQRTREAKMQLEQARTNQQMADKTHQKLLGDDKKQREILETMKLDIESKTTQLDIATDLVELFGPKGYRSVCFDGLVARIGVRAGQLLGIMTDSLYGTRLEQVGSDSKGNAKMILRPIVIKSGQDVPMDDLSGGARRRVMLAYDLSLSEAAGEGTPMFLDEALDGLDAVGKAEAMVLLEEVARTRAVVVVDHASEMKSAFQNVITVKYSQGTSTLVEGESI